MMTTESTTEGTAAEPVIDVTATEVKPAESVVETKAETPEVAGDAPDTDKPVEEAPVKRDGVQKRIAELTYKAHEAQRQAEHWHRIATENAQNATEPEPEAFDDPASYARAIAKWEAVQAVTTTRAETAQATATMARDDAWMARQADFAAQTPDYQKIVGESKIDIAPHVGTAIIESEYGPQLAYRLATDPDTAARLNGLSPNRALIEIGRMEAALSAPAVKVPSNAPPPPNPIAATRNTNVNLATADMDAYVAERRKQGARY